MCYPATREAHYGVAGELNCLGKDGAGDGTRTRDLLITNQLLYQLSYAGDSGRTAAVATAGITNSSTDPAARARQGRAGVGSAVPFWR